MTHFHISPVRLQIGDNAVDLFVQNVDSSIGSGPYQTPDITKLFQT
jgi:hypothetical protein